MFKEWKEKMELIKEALSDPDKVRLTVYFEGEELVVRIRKKDTRKKISGKESA